MALGTVPEIILFYQEPFAVVEPDSFPPKEPITTVPSFCRYAIGLGGCVTISDIYDKLLRYPIMFIPNIIKSLISFYQDIFGVWLLLLEPEKRQYAAFRGSSFFGSVVYAPRITNLAPRVEELHPKAIMAFLPKGETVFEFATQVGWPSREQMWIAVGVRSPEAALNTGLLRACQQQDFSLVVESFGVKDSFAFEFYPARTETLLTQEAYFLAYMDHVRDFGPFFFTCEPIRHRLCEAIQEYYAHRLNLMDLGGIKAQRVLIKEIELISYEYWRQLINANTFEFKLND